ncbi:MAG: hypothetical protein KKB81_01600 [Candidatus Margulisbacteria bacterium]|nr:hypothetical protein [Candidatus Margulisiibacteriota bacterium]MBU1021610.1 hypothetical protein [Candidatus Margulisiibacteriota bacterium]MBU1728761.1 hypothetical protein [Candidatus Margulisiibacteriota bacterium]MBU1955727.1 hypothetical protein [Candidatus Margulisiibacteriota bacterium]
MIKAFKFIGGFLVLILAGATLYFTILILDLAKEPSLFVAFEIKNNRTQCDLIISNDGATSADDINIYLLARTVGILEEKVLGGISGGKSWRTIKDLPPNSSKVFSIEDRYFKEPRYYVSDLEKEIKQIRIPCILVYITYRHPVDKRLYCKQKYLCIRTNSKNGSLLLMDLDKAHFEDDIKLKKILKKFDADQELP